MRYVIEDSDEDFTTQLNDIQLDISKWWGSQRNASYGRGYSSDNTREFSLGGRGGRGGQKGGSKGNSSSSSEEYDYYGLE